MITSDEQAFLDLLDADHRRERARIVAEFERPKSTTVPMRQRRRVIHGVEFLSDNDAGVMTGWPLERDPVLKYNT